MKLTVCLSLLGFEVGSPGQTDGLPLGTLLSSHTMAI